jgi:hypothetical protein
MGEGDERWREGSGREAERRNLGPGWSFSPPLFRLCNGSEILRKIVRILADKPRFLGYDSPANIYQTERRVAA